MALADELEAHLARLAALPFLFVGSGLSRRYLMLEAWRGLLAKFAEPLPRPIEYYIATADGDLPRAASLMSQDFHEVWWSSAAYDRQREQYRGDLLNQQSALKVAISAHMLERSAVIPPAEDELHGRELALLRTAVVDGIITTNWDLLLEGLFPDYRTYVGQNDVLFRNPQGVGEIYKIHGSCSAPNSLVLTSEDYQTFNDRNAYLAAKLLAVFVEHPVIFLGYSMSDPNILSILSLIADCLTRDNVSELQNRLIFVEYAPDSPRDILVAVPLVTKGLTLPITSLHVRDFVATFEVLARLHRRFPARLLRQLKEHVYELVKSNDPKERLFVQDIDDDTDLSGVEVVFGVGAVADATTEKLVSSLGYRSIKRSDLVDDILNDGGNLDPVEVVNVALPDLLKGAKYVPIYKYLRTGGYLSDDGAIVLPVPERVRQAVDVGEAALKRGNPYESRTATLTAAGTTLVELVERRDVAYVLWHVPLLPLDRVPPNVLRKFLIENRSVIGTPNESQYYKVVCLYDLIKYRSLEARG